MVGRGKGYPLVRHVTEVEICPPPVSVSATYRAVGACLARPAVCSTSTQGGAAFAELMPLTLDRVPLLACKQCPSAAQAWICESTAISALLASKQWHSEFVRYIWAMLFNAFGVLIDAPSASFYCRRYATQ